MIDLHIGDIQIAQYWYEQAQKTNIDIPDCVFRFMSYWVGFNFLYNSARNSYDETERTIINRFCSHPDVITKLRKYDPFSQSAISIFMEYPVFNQRTKPKNEIDYTLPISVLKKRCKISPKHIKCIIDWQQLKSSQNQDERILALIQIIYTVRCNLFHGSKSPHNERDMKLVQAATVIMEQYMKILLALEQTATD